MNATQEPNATGEKQSDNLSMAELIAQQSQVEQPAEVEEQPAAEAEPEEEPDAEMEEPTEGLDLEVEPDEETSPEAEEEPDEEAETEEEPEAEEGDPVDKLLELDESQIKELASKGKSRLLSRVGELTGKNKELQAEIDSLKQMQPIVSSDGIPAEYKALKTADAIEAKYEELNGLLSATDKLLKQYADYDPDDTIMVGDSEFSKQQIEAENQKAREGLNKHLPGQQRNIIRREQYAQAATMYEERAKQEVPEIQDEESEVGKKYVELINDPLVKRLDDVMPELGVQIKYVLAHTANSIFGKPKKVVPTGAGKKLKVKPPASPVGASAPSSRQSSKSKVEAAKAQFDKTGKQEDWVAYQLAKSNS